MARQKKLPGVDERKADEEMESWCDAYSSSVKRLVNARTKVGDLKSTGVSLFTGKGLESYTAEDGKTYSIASGKAKITITDPAESDEGDEDAAE